MTLAAAALYAVLSATSVTAQTSEPRRIELPRGDGTTIDISIWDRGAGADLALVVLGGSDCLPNEHRSWFGRVLEGAEARWVVSVDKEGAGHDPAAPDQCGPTYEQTSVEARRALDHVRALTWLRRDLDLPASAAFQLLATSAGGTAACAVAGATDDVQAMALLSTAGGASFADDMRQLTENEARIATEMERIQTDPRLGQTWLGSDNPEIWWWSALPLDCAGQMDGYAGPVLVVHGSEDQSSPVGSARRLVTLLEQRDGVSVDYVEMPGAGHDLFIASADKPEGGDGLDVALDWLADRAPD